MSKKIPVSNPLNTQVGGEHYKNKAIQPIEYTFANNLPFIEGSIVKYISRWREKNGLEDLLKVKHYIDLLISLEEKYCEGQSKYKSRVF